MGLRYPKWLEMVNAVLVLSIANLAVWCNPSRPPLSAINSTLRMDQLELQLSFWMHPDQKCLQFSAGLARCCCFTAQCRINDQVCGMGFKPACPSCPSGICGTALGLLNFIHSSFVLILAFECQEYISSDLTGSESRAGNRPPVGVRLHADSERLQQLAKLGGKCSAFACLGWVILKVMTWREL